MAKGYLGILVGVLLAFALILPGCSSPTPSSTQQSTTAKATTTAATTTTATTTAAAAPTSVTTTAAAATTPLKTWKLKFAYNQPATSPFEKYGHVPWAQDIEKATNGRVTLEMYPSDTLSKTTAILDTVKAGIADIGFVSTGNHPGQFEVSDSIGLPFVAPSGEIGSRVAWALYQKYPEIQAQFKDYQLITIYTGEPYYFINNNRFFKTVADFKGQKMRVQAGLATEMMKLLGGTPLFIPIPDAYANLQKKVVDGTCVPSEAITGFRLYEVAPYFTYVPTVGSTFLTVMNKNVWNGMPKDIQDAIMSVSGEKLAIRYGKDVFDGARKEMPAVIKAAGFSINEYTVPPEEVAKWNDLVGKPLANDWVTRMEAKGIKNAKQILDDTYALVKQYNK